MPTTDYVRYILALLVVLGLIVLLGHIAKKYNWAQWGVKMAGRNARRLRVVEMQSIDTRHRLAIVQRDAVEYVLAISPDRVTVLDTVSVATPLPAASLTDDTQGHPT